MCMSSWLLLLCIQKLEMAYFSVLATDMGEKLTSAAIAVAQYGRQHLKNDQLFNLLLAGGKVCMQMQSHIY